MHPICTKKNARVMVDAMGLFLFWAFEVDPKKIMCVVLIEIQG